MSNVDTPASWYNVAKSRNSTTWSHQKAVNTQKSARAEIWHKQIYHFITILDTSTTTSVLQGRIRYIPDSTNKNSLHILPHTKSRIFNSFHPSWNTKLWVWIPSNLPNHYEIDLSSSSILSYSSDRFTFTSLLDNETIITAEPTTPETNAKMRETGLGPLLAVGRTLRHKVVMRMHRSLSVVIESFPMSVVDRVRRTTESRQLT